MLGGALLVLVALGACSDDDAISTIPIPPTTAATSDAPPTDTTASSTPGPTGDVTAPSPPTQTSPPTTPSPDDGLAQLRSDVERDFLRGEDMLWELAQSPKVKNLRDRLAAAVIPGSPRYKSQLEVFRSMAATGERMVLLDPPTRRQAVELIEFPGAEPFTEAVVTSCDVNNANRVADGRGGDTVPVTERRGVGAFRVMSSLRLTDAGWKQYGDDAAVDYWDGRETCPEK